MTQIDDTRDLLIKAVTNIEDIKEDVKELKIDVKARLNDHGSRINRLEQRQSKLFGWLIGISGSIGAGAGVAVTKVKELFQ